MKTHTKGFTLVELLIVIAIVAVLSVVVIITLNPAELLRQTRDSNRISDMATIKSAMAIFLADVSTSTISNGLNTTCFASYAIPAASTTCGYFSATYTQAPVTTSSRKNSGTGWIPVNFTTISSGAPFGSLPIDPVNDGTYFYAYAANSSLQYEVDSRMESAKYSSAPGNVMNKDGGDNDNAYESGTNLTL